MALSSLHAASRFGKVAAARRALDGGAQVDRPNKGGATPLLLASQNGRTEVARLLLDRGADVNKRSGPFGATDGTTALHVACEKGRIGVATLCLDRGADIHLGDRYGATPLHLACFAGRVDLVLLCLDRGATVDRGNFWGQTPLFDACKAGHTDVARLCIERGAEVDPAEHQPFYIACCYGHVDAARLCMERGADINRASAVTGRTPHDVARHSGHPAMAAWLARILAAGGWTRYISESRYKLVVLRELVARGRARRERVFPFAKEQTPLYGQEHIVDLLFPGDHARIDQPRLPDELFAIIVGYYSEDSLSVEDKAAGAYYSSGFDY